MSGSKKYNVLDFPLHEVTTESIRLSENERKKYTHNLEKILESIINQMKTDETFKCLYRNMGYTGSSYENLKISKPNEFDINLMFVWPTDACQVIYDTKQPGYVKLKINLENPALKKKRDEVPTFDKQIKKWIDKNGFLMRDKFKSWMQGRVFKVLEAISVEGTEVKQSSSGPAITLKIQQPLEDLKYSLDLVPSFLFTEKDWPKPPVRGLPSSAKRKDWCVVPKEPTSEEEPVFWRMTFSTQEKELINNRGSVKHVIKLIKLLRDKENWINDLYSYAIKTVFLWECETLDPDFWKQGIGFLFVYMLQKLVDVYLTDGKIMFYWDKKLNIIGKMKDSTRKNMRDRILIILKGLNSSLENPYSVKKYFGCVPEKNVQNSSDGNTCSTLIDLDDVPDTSTLSNSFSISSPQDLLENEINPEEGNVNVDLLCTVEYNQKCDKDTTVDKDSTSAFELLKTLILKENQEIKETLQSILSQLSELNKEVKIIREENALMKKQLQCRASISTSPSNEIVSSFRDLSISHSPNSLTCSDRSLPSAIQHDSMRDSNDNLNQVPNSRIVDPFLHLLPDNFGK
ncbi:hypothetical protein R5R35_000342 [Gryllus longicercus]|uniref:Uncharacterized protein n=1 Tax=Gryllus longicercus TaxID=2509291 RepID=A0AAN9ZG55_9ORTH